MSFENQQELLEKRSRDGGGQWGYVSTGKTAKPWVTILEWFNFKDESWGYSTLTKHPDIGLIDFDLSPWSVQSDDRLTAVEKTSNMLG